MDQSAQKYIRYFRTDTDVLEDVWVSTAKKDEANAEESIRKLPESNPYKNKYMMKMFKSVRIVRNARSFWTKNKYGKS